MVLYILSDSPLSDVTFQTFSPSLWLDSSSSQLRLCVLKIFPHSDHVFVSWASVFMMEALSAGCRGDAPGFGPGLL